MSEPPEVASNEARSGGHESTGWEAALLMASAALVAVGIVGVWWASSDYTCSQTVTSSAGALITEVETCDIDTAEVTLVGLPLAAAGFLAIPFVMRKTGLTEAAGFKKAPPPPDAQFDKTLNLVGSTMLAKEREYLDGPVAELPEGTFVPPLVE